MTNDANKDSMCWMHVADDCGSGCEFRVPTHNEHTCIQVDSSDALRAGSHQTPFEPTINFDTSHVALPEQISDMLSIQYWQHGHDGLTLAYDRGVHSPQLQGLPVPTSRAQKVVPYHQHMETGWTNGFTQTQPELVKPWQDVMTTWSAQQQFDMQDEASQNMEPAFELAQATISSLVTPFGQRSTEDVPTVHIGYMWTTTNLSKVVFRCSMLGCTAPPFKRWYDLRRHYNGTHTAEGDAFWCEYPECERGVAGGQPFPRKDKLNDHLRQAHKLRI